jgi:AcrR family transcriptional regulator
MTQDRSRQRRERILDAAFHVFSRRGYRDTAVDDVARQAETSKGGLYFHFPTKESLFLELVRSTADKLVARVVRTVESEPDAIARAEAAIRVVLSTFAGHRTMARLLLIEGFGAGPVFRVEMQRLHQRFIELIAGYLDDAIATGVIPPIDTHIAGAAWFGAIHEVVMDWLTVEEPGRLEDAFPALRAILLRSVGISEARIGGGNTER